MEIEKISNGYIIGESTKMKEYSSYSDFVSLINKDIYNKIDNMEENKKYILHISLTEPHKQIK